ncbi:MAG: hypothetical protein Q7S43_00900 [bacterium]|nr:hypothetical protein [bacterium]
MQRTAVPINTYQNAIVGNIKDLFGHAPEEAKWHETGIADGFTGKQKRNNPPYRIPAADTGTEIFFDNLEVLSRFANMPLPEQEAFCKTIRRALREAGVDTLHLTVQWSETETKVLKITFQVNHHLDIYLDE